MRVVSDDPDPPLERGRMALWKGTRAVERRLRTRSLLQNQKLCLLVTHRRLMVKQPILIIF